MKKSFVHFIICLSSLSLLAAGSLECAKAASSASANNNSPRKNIVGKAATQNKSAKSTKVAAANNKNNKAKQKKTVALPEELFVGGRMILGSASALVLDQSSGKPILEKNPATVLPIASLSKLMMAIVLLDARLDMDEVIQITDDDVDYLRGSGSRLPVGLTMTRDTALLLALMSSENRASHALARHYPGGAEAFVNAMNRKARSLGLYYTWFEDPTGLSAQNVSNAHDLARLVMTAYQYPKIREYSTMEIGELDIGTRILTFRNTNALIKNENWQIGLSKTGYISEAGRCLVMQTWIADKPVIIVLLDSTGKMTRVGDAVRIKRWLESAQTRHTAPMPRSTGA